MQGYWREAAGFTSWVILSVRARNFWTPICIMASHDDVRVEGRDPLELVLAAINTSQAVLRKLREEVRGAQEDTAAKLAALKTERPYSFRKKGHEKQYIFNSSVNSKIAEAGLQLARVERGVADCAAKVAPDAAKEALAKGEQLMAQRQKLIKVADRSELGWAVVAEYQANDLAENSDDERKLEGAVKAAERKVAAKRRKLDTARGQTLAQAVSSKKEPFAAASSSAPAAAARVGSVGARRPIVCFRCGLTGGTCDTSARNVRRWLPACILQPFRCILMGL